MSGIPNMDDDGTVQHEEVQDEYTLTLNSGIEDESLHEQPREVKFQITSYGADYTVDTIVARLRSEAFYVPTFQRRFVWSQKHASRFIESLLMGLPVPGIFLYREPDTNRHLVVDGQQRLRTIQYFYDGVFAERRFRLIGVQQEWADKTYDELDAADKLKLDDSIIHATIFQQERPKPDQNQSIQAHRSLYFVFERINSGGIRLSPQEIRNCISEGALLGLVRELNDNNDWRFMFGEKTNTRLKDQELILRFFAMAYNRKNYERPMKDFLNKFAEDHKIVASDKIERFRRDFLEVIEILRRAKGRGAFRPSGPINAAVFEGVTIGLLERLNSNPTRPTDQQVAAAYDRLLEAEDFRKACERATADEETVKNRHSIAIREFSRI